MFQEKKTGVRARTRWDKDGIGAAASPGRTPQKNQPKIRLLPRSANEENELPYSPQRTTHKDPGELRLRASQRGLALQSSAVNARSPHSAYVRKAVGDKLHGKQQANSSLVVGKQQTLQPVVTGKRAPSDLWLRRCNSAPLPALKTSSHQVVVESENFYVEEDDEEEIVYDDADAALLRMCEKIDLDRQENRDLHLEGGEEQNSDSEKENLMPLSLSARLSGGTEQQDCVENYYSFSTSAARHMRRPLQPLQFERIEDSPSASPPETNASHLGLKRLQLPRSSAAKNLGQMFRRITLSDGAAQQQWHMVVDTSCLLEPISLKTFGELEGIKETRVIIPQIVIRELDSLKHRHGSSYAACTVLNWIDSCMMRVPAWIHVQNSSETTPPANPSGGRVPRDLMSPTNDDHILECALLFDKKIRDGRVALLTRNTALRIKARAEGLVAENEMEFCESLLSPYSERFLWAGSKAHGKTWTDRSRLGSPTASLSPRSRFCSANKLVSPLAGLHQHFNEQPKGLRLVLA